MSPDKQTLDELRIDRQSAPARKTPTVLIVLIVLLLTVAAAVIWWFNRPKPVLVRTLVVQQSAAGGERTLLNASGYVKARREATVSSKVTGKVVEVLVEEGMKVEDGQVLARIDSSNVEKSFQLSEAQAESSRKALEETQANLEQAERELRRMMQLAENKIANQSDLDRTEAAALRDT